MLRFSDPISLQKSSKSNFCWQNQYIVEQTGDENKDNHQYGIGWRKLCVVVNKVQMQQKYITKLSVTHIKQIFFLSFFQDFSVTRRLRKDKGKDKTRHDTGGNIKKLGHLRQTYMK